jgi:peroxiredoxin Q/BCP
MEKKRSIEEQKKRRGRNRAVNETSFLLFFFSSPLTDFDDRNPTRYADGDPTTLPWSPAMKLSCLLLLVIGVVLMSPLHSSAKDLEVGDEAPAFELPGSDDETYKLEDFKDKQVVVIAWFPKAFTGGCTKECKSMRASGDAIRKYDVAYFTASCDEPEKNKDFAKSLELDYPILSDPEKSIAEAYGVVHEGREVPERWTFYVGLDGKILAIDKKINTETAGEDIAKQLKELGVAEKKAE